MALDRPFDDGLVETAKVTVNASTVSANIIYDLLFMLTSKRTLYFRHFRLTETAETMLPTSEGGGRPQSFTQAAPNELKLGEGGVKW